MAKRRSKKTATSTPAKRKQPQKPPGVAERKLADGRRIYTNAIANFAAIQEADAARKVKLLPKARLEGYALLIRQTSTAMTSHQVQKGTAKGATANEAKLRVALVEKVRDVRDLVATAYAGDTELGGAFGVAKRLSKETNKDALALAAEQQQAFEHPVYGPKARAVGITPKQIASLVSSRRALAAAETAQSQISAAKKGEGQDKAALLKKLDVEKEHVKKVAAIVFKGQTKILAQFAPAPKARVKPRKPKAAPPAPPAPPKA
jgi:hypothetical protein